MMILSSTPIHGWYPNFDSSGNFEEVSGWDVVLRELFTVLVTRPGSRQWNPDYGCKLMDVIYDTNTDKSTFESIVKDALKWVPELKMKGISIEVNDMTSRTGKSVSLSLDLEYSGEKQKVSVTIPSQLSLTRGVIYQIKVKRGVGS